MSTGTSLVHPDTAKLTPDAQKKGIYHYTPPEVLAFNNGESLTDEDLAIVRKFYGGVIPNITPDNGQHEVPAAPANPAPRRVESQPALAAPYGQQPKKLVKKKVDVTRPTPLDAAYILADSLYDDEAYSLLCQLAARFNFDIE